MKPIILVILCMCFICEVSDLKAQSPEPNPHRILLMPEPGKMHCNVVIRDLKREVFALTLPETIGCREQVLLNFPETAIEWKGPDEKGRVSTSWTVKNRIAYSLSIEPHEDYVDARMEVRNLSQESWHEVWAFHCLSPTRAGRFKDSLLNRTFLSYQGQPQSLAAIEGMGDLAANRSRGLYLQEKYREAREYPFISDLNAIRTEVTDDDYIVALSDSTQSYIAAACPQALFLFHNPKFNCIHAAPAFGDIAPGEARTLTSRFYFAKGGLDTFIKRYRSDFPD